MGTNDRRVNVHIYPSPMVHESRIFKITSALAAWRIFDRILIVGTAHAPSPSVQPLDAVRTIHRLKRGRDEGAGSRSLIAKIWAHVGWLWRVYSLTSRQSVACINCHSLPVLPLCVLLKWRTGARLIYDTHELETETNGLSGTRQILYRLMERMFIPFADQTVVVGEMIGDWYAQRYGFERPTVVLNCPPRATEKSESTRLREILGLDDETLIFLYQGLLAPGRGVDLLIDAFLRLDDRRRVLVLMGMGPMEARARHLHLSSTNIRYVPAVAPQEVLAYTSSADVGFCLMEDTCLSHRLSMPNKLFEYISAGVPAIVTPLPEISRVVTANSAGWVARDWSTGGIAALVSNITRGDIDERRAGVDRAAQKYNWESQVEPLRSVYRRLGF